jgi:hypothetical protein
MGKIPLAENFSFFKKIIYLLRKNILSRELHFSNKTDLRKKVIKIVSEICPKECKKVKDKKETILQESFGA